MIGRIRGYVLIFLTVYSVAYCLLFIPMYFIGYIDILIFGIPAVVGIVDILIFGIPTVVGIVVCLWAYRIDKNEKG